MMCPECKKEVTQIAVYPETKWHLDLKTKRAWPEGEGEAPYLLENSKNNLECEDCGCALRWEDLSEDEVDTILNHFEL